MKTLYLDCSMGAAGDMLSAALYELLDDKEGFLEKVKSVGIDKVTIEPLPMSKCGILGTHMNVMADGVSEEDVIKEYENQSLDHDHHDTREHLHNHDHDHDHDHDHHHNHNHDNEHDIHDHDTHNHNHNNDDDCDRNHEEYCHEHEHSHHHSSPRDIEEIISGLNVSDKVKNDAKKVYALIAEAESSAHGVPIGDIHFHEVGTMDAVADVMMVCMLMEELKADKIFASPIHLGSGHVHCAHGILPVPAPATAFILKGVPVYSGNIKGELCTPTGAALLKYFVSSFGSMPVMTVDKIGYGMGFKDFEQANCVRAFLGNTAEEQEEIIELCCNVDDMTPERIAFATELFMSKGALEAYTIPVGMKKSRPGILICVMCKESIKEEMIKLIFKHTTTLGVRENISRRYTLKRNIVSKETDFGAVRIKQSVGFGVKREKIEYEDLARIARENNISVNDAENLLN